MKVQVNYNITLGTKIEDDRIQFTITATARETIQGEIPPKHTATGDTWDEAFGLLENKLLMEFQTGQRP